jgi:membrane-bound lytic murein transglycosylase D
MDFMLKKSIVSIILIYLAGTAIAFSADGISTAQETRPWDNFFSSDNPAVPDTHNIVIPESRSTVIQEKQQPIQETQQPSSNYSYQAPAEPAIDSVDTVNTQKNAAPKVDDVWQRIRNGFAFKKDVSGKTVKKFEQWYANRPDYVQRMCERSQRYLYHIVEEIEKRGMPTEIALLPMIESAYNPMAYSRSNAVGIWQFIPSTAKIYGLERNWWYDGRRDIFAATNSALDYLQYLYKLFGDWHLALAAYNWGEGAVKRAIAKNRARGKKTDYESLKMPKETRQYIPKLQAIKNIISNPSAYGLVLPPIPNHPQFARVTAPHHIDVKLAAQFADMTVEEFTSLNPAYNRPVIASKGDTLIVLPIEKAEPFSAKFETHDKPLTSWKTYILKPGEKLEDVAEQFNLTLNELRNVNGIRSYQKVKPGYALLVPADAESNDDRELNLAAYNNNAIDNHPPGDGKVHRVKSGQTLYSIARQYHISVNQIKSWNHLSSNTIRPGQKLVVYAGGASPSRKKIRVANKNRR